MSEAVVDAIYNGPQVVTTPYHCTLVIGGTSGAG
jgi:hypothetical protein